MGMYTELVLGLELRYDPDVIDILNYMLHEGPEPKINVTSHPLFQTDRWRFMLTCDSYYFDGQTDSKLFSEQTYVGPFDKTYYLNVRCNLKNYCSEIEKFLDWLAPYIETDGFVGYFRYEEFDDPTLIYNDRGTIRYKATKDDYLTQK